MLKTGNLHPQCHPSCKHRPCLPIWLVGHRCPNHFRCKQFRPGVAHVSTWWCLHPLRNIIDESITEKTPKILEIFSKNNNYPKWREPLRRQIINLFRLFTDMQSDIMWYQWLRCFRDKLTFPPWKGAQYPVSELIGESRQGMVTEIDINVKTWSFLMIISLLMIQVARNPRKVCAVFQIFWTLITT